MLVLTRKADESILIGDDIEIEIRKVQGGRVSIGVKAPENMRIRRQEKHGRGDQGVRTQAKVEPDPT